MLEELEILINKIQAEYNKITELWCTESVFKNYNLSKSLAKQFSESELLKGVFEYVSFLNDKIYSFMVGFDNWDKNGSKVTSRVKARNSIAYKIASYIVYHEGGEVPVKKCLNDLFGIRIILDGDYTHEQISEFVKSKFDNIKCICSNKQEYIATHIYFKYPKQNRAFQWELQIWLSKYEHSNKVSHNKYKQDYVNWEKRFLKEEI